MGMEEEETSSIPLGEGRDQFNALNYDLKRGLQLPAELRIQPVRRARPPQLAGLSPVSSPGARFKWRASR